MTFSRIRMSGARRQAGLVLVLTLLLVPAIRSHGNGAESDPTEWARGQIESTLKDCSKKSAQSVFKSLKTLQGEYSARVDKIPVPQLVEMSQNSDFIEMGEVLFPAMLPKKFPGKLLYMTCDEEHGYLQESKTLQELRFRLGELKKCFQNSYQIERPALVDVVLACYQDLLPK